MNFDVMLRGAEVVDGTGRPRYKADVGILGDKITAIGDLSHAMAKHVVDAAGKIVAPGFIDVHVHSELALLGGRDQYAPLKMGVTTQLSAPDGFSWAPLEGEAFREMRAQLHVFYEDGRLQQLRKMSVADYLSMFRGNLPSNLVLQVPHGSIRCAVMGWETRPASEDELNKMEQHVMEWMEAGAKAFCTGLEYEPMRRADTRELIHLAKVAVRYGGLYVAHQRGYGDQVETGCRETFRIGEEAGVPVHISHLAVNETAEGLLDEAIRQGLSVSFDMYPYRAGCTHLLYGLPEPLQAGPPENILSQLRDLSVRKAMQDHVERAFPPDRVVFAAAGAQQATGWEGKTLGQVSELLGLSVTDTICHILLETKLQALMVFHWDEQRYGELEKTFRHKLHMVSTDGVYVGEKPHPRGFGTFPKALGSLVREERWLTLEQAVYKMSGYPAKVFQIPQRGTIEVGNFADLVVFDPDSVDGKATYAHPRTDPVGIEHVLVNGQLALSNGRIVQGLHGRLIE